MAKVGFWERGRGHDRFHCETRSTHYDMGRALCPPSPRPCIQDMNEDEISPI